MSGPKAFGQSRISQPLGAVTIDGLVLDGGLAKEVGTLSGLADFTQANPQDANFLATGSLLYGVVVETDDQMARLQVAADSYATNAPKALVTLARSQMKNNAGWVTPVVVDHTQTGSTSKAGAQLVAAPSDSFYSDAPGAATQALASLADSLAQETRVTITSVAGNLIIPPGVNQPAIALEIVLEETIDPDPPTFAVLWSHQFGVGAAVVDALVQSFALSGLNWVVNMSADAPGVTSRLLIRFSAAGAAGTLQSVSASVGLTPV